MRSFIQLLIPVFALVSFSAQAIDVKFEKDTAVPLVYLNIVFKAGASHDPDGKRGLTNFMGEMLLRGTSTMKKSEFDQALDQIGASLEFETRSEFSVFRGVTLAKELPRFLALVESVIANPSFDDSEMKKLKSQIVSQILEERGRDQSLARMRFEEYFFGNHPYGNPILGKVNEVEKLTKADLLAHYKKAIQAPSMFIVGTGDAESAVIENWAKKIETARPKNDAGVFEKIPAPLIQAGRRIAILDKPDRTQTQVLVSQPGMTMTDRRYFPFYLGNQAFGGGSFSARLMVEIRVKRGWSYGAYAYQRFGIEPRNWQAYTFPAAKDTPEAVARIIDMIGDWKRNGITEEEFTFNQQSMVNSSGFLLNTSKKRVENTLLEQALNLPDGFFKSYRANLEQLTRAQVNDTVREFINPEQLTVFILGTAKELRPRLAKTLGVDEKTIEVIPFQ